MVAFALRADGWYLRSDIVWSKPNPMPESVTDRPTKSHEYVFLLSKSQRYFFDQDAVREPLAFPDFAVRTSVDGQGNGELGKSVRFGIGDGSGRNIRSVWEIATQPYPLAHFATFPRELPERCIKAGCPESVCSVCGKAREQITASQWDGRAANTASAYTDLSQKATNLGGSRQRYRQLGMEGPQSRKLLGFTDCGHGPDSYVPGTVLDPFAGSGTTLAVARDLGRKSIGIELNREYVRLIEQRVAQNALAI